MNSIKNNFKKIISVITLSTFLSGGIAIAEEIIPSKSKLEKVVSQREDPKFEFIYTYQKEKKREAVDYSTFINDFDSSKDSLKVSSITPQVTFDEKNSVEDVLKDIKYNSISSYDELITKSKNFSEKQKIILLSSISNLIKEGTYDISKQSDGLPSQEEFFGSLQDYLLTGNEHPSGACAQIASNIEEFANDLGIRTAVVTGQGQVKNHAYDILKLEDGTAILNYGHIFLTNTKNIKKTLEDYQNTRDALTFQHLFFEDSKFKYELITEDGENFLDFIDYDRTSETLKNSLIQEPIQKSSTNFTASLETKDYSNSLELNYLGYFIKVGGITRGESSSSKFVSLAQLGYKNNFNFGNITLTPKLSVFNGKELIGPTGDLMVNINGKRLNLASRLAGNITLTSLKDLSASYYDLLFESGVSYKISSGWADIKPYSTSQFKLLNTDVCEGIFLPAFNEFRIGTALNFPRNKIFSVEPYYLKRIWEQGGGINTAVNSKKLGLNLGGYATKSNYDFCPDKFGGNVGLRFSPTKNMDFNLNLKDDVTNYDGEIDHDYSFGINGKLRF